jgi:hypothetical protein
MKTISTTVARQKKTVKKGIYTCSGGRRGTRKLKKNQRSKFRTAGRTDKKVENTEDQ